MACTLSSVGFSMSKPVSPDVWLCTAHPSRVPHSHSLGAPQEVPSPCCLCSPSAGMHSAGMPWHRFCHDFFSIQVPVSLPVQDNASFHTGSVLQVLRDMIKHLSADCPFPVSMATMIKRFFSHISGMPFTSFLPTPQFPSGGGNAPSASSRTDLCGKGSVLPTPPGQMLQGMGQHGVAGTPPCSKHPRPKHVVSEDAMVTPGPHQECAISIALFSQK